MAQITITSAPEWRYCAIGNIVETHLDQYGIIRNGAPAYKPGTKVYISGRLWDPDKMWVEVLGLGRKKEYVYNFILPEWIENVRPSKTYRPCIVSRMYMYEGYMGWWGNEYRDKQDIDLFVEEFNRYYQSDELTEEEHLVRVQRGRIVALMNYANDWEPLLSPKTKRKILENYAMKTQEERAALDEPLEEMAELARSRRSIDDDEILFFLEEWKLY